MGPIRKVKCDCCGTETMAEIRDNKLVIIDKRHGRKHMVVLTLEEIVVIMEGLTRLEGLAALTPAER